TTPLLAQENEQEPELAMPQPVPEQPAPGQLAQPAAPAPPEIMAPASQKQIAVIRAQSQEKAGDIYTLRGQVEIDYKGWVLHSDEATYNDDTGEAVVTGHVVLDGGPPYNEHITGSHGTYNVQTETGKFYDAVGTVGFRFHGLNRVALVNSTPFAFSGKEIDKTGENRYVIHHGTVTSCELPRPKWTFSAPYITVELGEEARIYEGTFKIRGAPVMFFPFAQHPAARVPRQSGFLIPSIGTSNVKGFIFGDAFYWAINRSMDATMGAELWSSRGWAQHGAFRAVPNESSYISASYFGVIDRGAKNLPNETGQDIRGTATDMFLPDLRGVISAEYLSSYIFRQGFSETFSQAINSEVNSAAFLSKSDSGFYENFSGTRYQNFQSNTAGDVVTILKAPALDVASVDRSIGSSRFFWSYDGSLGGLSRTEPGFSTADLVGRVDLRPSLSYSLVSHGWTLRPEIALRDTFYTEQRRPAAGIGIALNDPVNRRSIEGSFELRPPSVGRIFRKPVFGYRLKHTIEPRLVYDYVQGVRNFDRIIRFDETDVLADTNQFEVGVINRLYGKKIDQRCGRPLSESALEQLAISTGEGTLKCIETGPRELASWELGQAVYFNRDFGGALVPGVRNVFSSTVDYSGIAFLTDPRRLAPVISRLRISPNAGSAAEWDLDYDSKKGRINASTVLATFYRGNVFFGAGHTYLLTPGEVFVSNGIIGPSKFNQFRLTAGYGNAGKRGFTGAASVGFDAQNNFIQYSAIQTTYNWDCCGFTTEYRRLALGALRNENQFRFAFTIANVGTFGTLRRQERIY
ncbi:MAG TPA: LPS assembly protein LptD, partial [Terriglobales bacterium]|nr:LPS assembly protein LptD [Terriglobales bacterium]